MRFKSMNRLARLSFAIVLSLLLGGFVSGCESHGVGPSGPEGGGEETEVASIGEQLGFEDGDMLNVERGIEINFSTPLDPDTLFDTGTESDVGEGFRVSFTGPDGGLAEIYRWQLRNGNTTLFLAFRFLWQSQYLLRLHAGLGNTDGEVLSQPVEGVFLTPPNRFSLFGDNHSSIATQYLGYGYAVPTTLFVGDGSVTYLGDVLESVLEIGDGIDMVGNLINLNRNGAAAANVENVALNLREARYGSKVVDGLSTRFVDQSELCAIQGADSLEDLSGDGVAELLLSYRCDDGLGGRFYRDYLFYGRNFAAEESLESADFSFSVPAAPAIPPAFGADSGDVNDDGYNDLVWVAYDEAMGKGVVNIHMGGPGGLLASASGKGLLSAPQVRIHSADEASSPLHLKLGDVNGDGIDDIVLVEIKALVPVKSAYELSYRFVVILGRESFESEMYTSPAFATIDCENQIACGQTRASFEVEDVDGDEIADLLIGSSRYSGVKNISSSGVVYLIFGGEELKDDSGNQIDTVSMADRYIFAPNVREFGANIEYMGDMYDDGGNYFSIIGKSLDVDSIVYFIYDGLELKEMAGKVVGEDYILDSFLPTMKKPK